MKRLAGIATREMWGAFAVSLLLTAGAVLMFWTGWSDRTPPLALAAAIAGGIGLWLALDAAIRHPLVAELKRIAGVASLCRVGAVPKA